MRPDSSSLAVETESIGASTPQMVGGLDRRNLAKFIDVVGSQLYSNPIESIVREITSNCFDSHAEYEKFKRQQLGDDNYVYQEPVIVKYTEEEGQGFVSFIDVGVGLSPDRMQNIYLNFLSSTKEDNDDEHGYFGLGAKSFLSYTPSIEVITRYNRIEYHYVVGKNSQGLYAADLLIKQETTEHNGTEVKICIGKVEYVGLGYTREDNERYDYKAKDYPKFREAVVKQLYYFDNLYTVGFDLDNNYQIYEADTFKIRSGLNPFKEMHLILGKVAYPIDWGTLGKEPIYIPVGIKFNIGELFVTPSRESIRYENPEKNALISSRIEETIQEIKKRYNKNSSIVDTLDEYVRQIALPDKILVIEDVEIKLPKKAVFDSKKGAYDNIDIIEGLENVKWKPLAHLPISIPEDPYLIFFIKGKLSRPDGRGNCKLEGTSKKNDFIFVQGNKDNVYRIKGDRNKATDLYLSWKHQGTKSPVLISKTYASYKTFCEALDLGKKVTKEVSGSILLGKKKIRTPIIFPITINGKTEYWNKLRIIQEYKKIITRDLISRTLSYEKEEPSAAYLSALQLARIAKKRPKLEGKITVYDLVNDNSSTGTELDLSSLEKYKGFIIYGEREKIKELQGVKEMLSNKAPITTPRKTKIINTGKKIKKKFSSYHKPVEVYEFRTVEYGGKEISRTKKELYQAVIRNEAGRVLIVAKSNQKHLKENPYFMHVDEFMSNNNRMFRNAVTAWYINREFKIIRNTYSNLINNLARINDRLSKSYIELSRWVETNWTPYYVNEDFMKVCLGIAKENNFLWQDKVEELEQIKTWFTPDLRIFQKIDDSVFQDENMFKDVIALLKMKHKRLSAEHYFVPTVEEEKIIEEAVEKKTYSLVVGEMTKQLLIYNNQKTA